MAVFVRPDVSGGEMRHYKDNLFTYRYHTPAIFLCDLLIPGIILNIHYKWISSGMCVLNFTQKIGKLITQSLYVKLVILLKF